MAVQNKYVDTTNISGNSVLNRLSALTGQGTGVRVLAQTFEVAAADDDGSVFRVFKNLAPNVVPLAILVSNDALTAGTSWDVGLYKPDLGAVIDADCFAATLDLSAAHKLGAAAALSGLSAVDQANVLKAVYEHAQHTIEFPATMLQAYDLALTANTIGSVAGTVTVVLLYATP